MDKTSLITGTIAGALLAAGVSVIASPSDVIYEDKVELSSFDDVQQTACAACAAAVWGGDSTEVESLCILTQSDGGKHVRAFGTRVGKPDGAELQGKTVRGPVAP
jgi:hypothetical protein